MISVRVSEGEYAAMRAICTSYGARNVSDFARLALQRAISDSFGTDMGAVSTLREFSVRLNSLEERVLLLLGRTDRTLPIGASESADDRLRTLDSEQHK